VCLNIIEERVRNCSRPETIMTATGITTRPTEKGLVSKRVDILVIGRTTKDKASESSCGPLAANTAAIGKKIRKKVLVSTNGSQATSTVVNGSPALMNMEVTVVILAANMLATIIERASLMEMGISFILTVISGSAPGKMESPLTLTLVCIRI